MNSEIQTSTNSLRFSLPSIILANLLGNRSSLLLVVIGRFWSILFVSVFQGSLAVTIIMIDGSEKPNRQLGFDLQSSHVTENRNNYQMFLQHHVHLEQLKHPLNKQLNTPRCGNSLTVPLPTIRYSKHEIDVLLWQWMLFWSVFLLDVFKLFGWLIKEVKTCNKFV